MLAGSRVILRVSLTLVTLIILSPATTFGVIVVIDNFEEGAMPRTVGTNIGGPLSPISCIATERVCSTFDLPPIADLVTELQLGEVDDALSIKFPAYNQGVTLMKINYECMPTDITGGGTNDRVMFAVSHVDITDAFDILLEFTDADGRATHALVEGDAPGTHEIRFSQLFPSSYVDPTRVVGVEIHVRFLRSEQVDQELRISKILAMPTLELPEVFYGPQLGGWTVPPMPVEAWTVDPSVYILPDLASEVMNFEVQMNAAHPIPLTPDLTELEIVGGHSGGDLWPIDRNGWTVYPGPDEPTRPRPFGFEFSMTANPSMTGPYQPSAMSADVSWAGSRLFFVDIVADIHYTAAPAPVFVGSCHQRLRVELPEDSPLVMGSVDLVPAGGDQYDLLFEIEEAPRPMVSKSATDTRIIQLSVSGEFDHASPPTSVPIERVPTQLRIMARPSVTSGITSLIIQRPLAEAGEIQIHDVAGRLVRTLLVPSGSPAVTWDGRDNGLRSVSSGMYLLRLATPSGVATGRLVLAR